MAVTILSDEGARSQARELEQLIKIINYSSEITHVDYDEWSQFEKDDKIFAMCPSKFINWGMLYGLAIETNQITPVTYLGSKEHNFPSSLQSIARLTISGNYLPSSAVDDLCKTLNVSNTLRINYPRLLFLRNNSLQKSLVDSISSLLSHLKIAQDIKAIPALQYAQNLQQTTRKTAEKLQDILVSLPESEQRQIADILEDTSLGNYLEKISPEITQEDIAMTTTYFRL